MQTQHCAIRIGQSCLAVPLLGEEVRRHERAGEMCRYTAPYDKPRVPDSVRVERDEARPQVRTDFSLHGTRH